jgi:hypothetical protein
MLKSLFSSRGSATQTLAPERSTALEAREGTSTSRVRNFDLNIEKILEGWQVCHAIRELIANALDEQALTGTQKSRLINSASVHGASATMGVD